MYFLFLEIKIYQVAIKNLLWIHLGGKNRPKIEQFPIDCLLYYAST